MPENMIKVVQLKDPTTKEPVSPVVGISSIYDNNGNNIGEQFTNPGLPVRDIRSFPIRTGESISAGDVVNVGRDIISVTTFGDLDVGSIVQIDENGSPVNYIVVNQGIPANDSRKYDSSCDGTWLLRQDIAEQRVWDADNSNQYANSDINTYLNGDWMNRYDSTTLENIKTVKIPYCVGGGLSTVNSGANGLSVRAFLLGCFEVGWDSLDSRYFPIDGRLLSYFEDGNGSSANQKRIANFNDNASSWGLRSPVTADSGFTCAVHSNGTNLDSSASLTIGVRPCIIFDSSTVIDDGETIYGPETVFKNMSDSQNISSHAIALESGTGGETIKLGYGGYCECPGVAAGDEIMGSSEDAVSAIAPKPGWLWINPAHTYDNTVREPIDVPTVSGTLTYNGQAQSPTWNGYDAGKMTIGGNTSATNAGEYTATFTPKEGYCWSDGTLGTKSVQWNIGKATPALSLNPTSLSLVGPTPKTSTITYNGDGELSAQSQNSEIATATISGSNVSVTGVETGSTTINVNAAEGTNYAAASASLSVSVQMVTVCGVCWNKSNTSTALTRLTPSNDPNHHVNMQITTEPTPAVGTDAGSSPFDDIMPWSGMYECNVNSGGTETHKKGDLNFSRHGTDAVMIWIPEFWYKVVQSGNVIYYYIADNQIEGFQKHPGSGKYVGKYLSAGTTSLIISKSGTGQMNNISIAQARKNITSKGSKWHLYDMITYCAIALLYLIEFADWDSQSKIGRGYVDAGPQTVKTKNGGTDAMLYHTGRAAGTDGTASVQYRGIENLWGNICQWVDGVNMASEGGLWYYVCLDPSKYGTSWPGDDEWSEIMTPEVSGYIKSFGFSQNLPWLFAIDEVGGSSSTYVPDYLEYSGSDMHAVCVGGWSNSHEEAGLFYQDVSMYSNDEKYSSNIKNRNTGMRCICEKT